MPACVIDLREPSFLIRINKMAREEITPEDKLLRLIETPAKIRAAFFGRKKVNKSPAPKNVNPLKISPDIFTLDSLIKLLTGLSVVITLVLIWQIAANIREFSGRDLGLEGAASRKAEIKVVPLLPLTNYLEEFVKMSMFSGLSEVAVEEVQAQVQEEITAQLKNLKLVGIIWSDKPQAMIENITEEKTMLLNVGDQIDKIKIKSISQDKVILGVDSQEWELR